MTDETTTQSDHDPIIDPAEFRRVSGTSHGRHRGDLGYLLVAGRRGHRFVRLDLPSTRRWSASSSAPTQSSGAVIKDGRGFCVNVLNADQLDLCGVMASKADDKFSGVSWTPSMASGCPVLPDIHAVIDCRPTRSLLGDHELIVGRAEHLDTVEGESGPMVFRRQRPLRHLRECGKDS
ncbi:MAG: flavin reductase family protein [Acidimicrobiales bacterium]